jgi:hypothetical protein
MTQDEVNSLYARVVWLERKMVRMLWLMITVASAFCGFVVAYSIDNSFGWPSLVVAVGIWLALGFILQRQEFKGAPEHIEFIDP